MGNDTATQNGNVASTGSAVSNGSAKLHPDIPFEIAMKEFIAGRVTPAEFAVYQTAREAMAAEKAAGAAGRKSGKGGAPKTLPPAALTREVFIKEAKAVEVVLNGITLGCEPRQFSTGSLGWNLNGKITLKVGDMHVTCQLGMNLTVVGSKELPGFSPASS